MRAEKCVCSQTKSYCHSATTTTKSRTITVWKIITGGDSSKTHQQQPHGQRPPHSTATATAPVDSGARSSSSSSSLEQRVFVLSHAIRQAVWYFCNWYFYISLLFSCVCVSEFLWGVCCVCKFASRKAPNIAAAIHSRAACSPHSHHLLAHNLTHIHKYIHSYS